MSRAANVHPLPQRVEPEFYTPRELAGILRVHYETVLEMIHDGEIKAIRVGRSRGYRISAAEVARLRAPGSAERPA